jgi:hypothetical protein
MTIGRTPARVTNTTQFVQAAAAAAAAAMFILYSLIRLVVFFFVVAEFIVSLRTFFSGCKCE